MGPSTHNTSPTSVSSNDSKPNLPHIRIVPHIVDVRKCLYFDVMDRDVPPGQTIKVGRFTEKAGQQNNRIAFKSKVVSRSHAEIWSEGFQVYIRDVGSSSGTFLNHMRLAPPNVESDRYPLHDGDILQLGVDYQGGTVDLFKCVKIRLEINRNWQRSGDNPFRQQVLRNIQDTYHQLAAGQQPEGTDKHECCICLYPMGAFQALFVAPCSHCFHFKCIKPILFTSTGFSCPLCRTYADLEASVTVDEDEEVNGSNNPVPLALPPSATQPQPQQQQQQQQQHDQSQQDTTLRQGQTPTDNDNSSNNGSSSGPSGNVHAVAAAAAAVSAAITASNNQSQRQEEAGNDNCARPTPISSNASPTDAVSVTPSHAQRRYDVNSTPISLDHRSDMHSDESHGTTPVGSIANSINIIDPIIQNDRDIPESPTRPNSGNGGSSDGIISASGPSSSQDDARCISGRIQLARDTNDETSEVDPVA